MHSVADSMVSSGLVAAGYNYLNVDDLWAADQRNVKGEITADAAKFPSGMPALAQYLKDRGMKLGLYTSRNVRTCSGKMPGSLGHEVIDAKTFAAMGAEFLKNVGHRSAVAISSSRSRTQKEH
jgi:alpha-galactosidase|eukprot:COSAG02_NODE_1265_length_13542_cov_5.803615_16_plen_123_part_00